MSSDSNENWGECPKCGAPVLINPDTSQAEACSNCAAQASPWGLYLGMVGILFGIAVVVLLLYIGCRLWLG